MKELRQRKLILHAIAEPVIVYTDSAQKSKRYRGIEDVSNKKGAEQERPSSYRRESMSCFRASSEADLRRYGKNIRNKGPANSIKTVNAGPQSVDSRLCRHH
jgi:hypothetical protein